LPKSNRFAPRTVYPGVDGRFACLVLSVVVLGAASGDLSSAREKIGRIESDKLRAGTRVDFTASELLAWVTPELPNGVRNARLEFPSGGVVKGSALVDFAKVRRAQGYEPGWLMTQLLQGERPVSVTARIRTGSGQATVDVERVTVSSLEIDGATLDFLIQNFLLPAYPDAAVGRPFEMGYRIEKLDVQPHGVGVVIGR
jgi:hypothetical protein